VATLCATAPSLKTRPAISAAIRRFRDLRLIDRRRHLQRRLALDRRQPLLQALQRLRHLAERQAIIDALRLLALLVDQLDPPPQAGDFLA